MNTLLPDFKSGPLDSYRKSSSFNWKDMKLNMENIEELEYYKEIIDKLKAIEKLEDTRTEVTLSQVRYKSAKRMKFLSQLNISDTSLNISKQMIISRIMIQWDASSITKYMMSAGLCVEVLRRLGTERHESYINATLNWNAIGCFCLTEISHGTNVKGIRTTATYNCTKQQFILHSPDFEAAKCWSGNLGQSATYAIVYAKLYVSNGQYLGLHAFVVDIRDPQTLIPYSGVTIGDMGAKAGLNGVDNGFILFQNYHIPRESLLNKLGDVTRKGKYITSLEGSKKFGASLGALSSGRITIIQNSVAYLEKALTIAIRYSAIQKQFNDGDYTKISNLEFQLNQWTLLPYLASCYVLKNFAKYIATIYDQYINDENLSQFGIEIHAVSSSGKALSTWLVRDAIQACIEACGGYACLKVCELTDLRNDHEASCTYEGESNVLCQQTSNWLMKNWKSHHIPETPLNSIYYLNDANKILKTKININSIDEILDCNNILKIYKWLVIHVLKKSYEKIDNLFKNGMSSFATKNNSQIFYMRTLSIIFIQHLMIEKMVHFIKTIQSSSLKNVLNKLLSLYGLKSLEEHINILYEGEIVTNTKINYFIKEGILQLCHQLKNEAVTLIDAIAPNDFLIKSPIGKSDGQMYRHLEEAFTTSSRNIIFQGELIRNLNNKL